MSDVSDNAILDDDNIQDDDEEIQSIEKQSSISDADEDEESKEISESESEESNDSAMDSVVLEHNQGNKQPNERRITSAFLTKYEKARVIGVRA